jgi:hypothetical protein
MAEITLFRCVLHDSQQSGAGGGRGMMMGVFMLELTLFSLEKSLICRKKLIDCTYEFPINLSWNAGHFA